MTVGEKIKRIRKQKGLSQTDLAKLVGYTHKSAIAKIEARPDAKQSTILKFAKALNVSPVELLPDLEEVEQDPDSVDLTMTTPETAYNVPLYASVSAGAGCLANEDIIGTYMINARSRRDAAELFALLVQGDSMQPEIHDGDIITVRKQDSVDSGDVAVVRVDGEEGLVKRVKYGNDWIQLESINDKYPPRYFKGEDVLRVEVIGKVLDARHRVK